MKNKKNQQIKLNSFYFIKSYKKRIKNDIREQKKAHNLKLFFNINNDRDAQLRPTNRTTETQPSTSDRRHSTNGQNRQAGAQRNKRGNDKHLFVR